MVWRGERGGPTRGSGVYARVSLASQWHVFLHFCVDIVRWPEYVYKGVCISFEGLVCVCVFVWRASGMCFCIFVSGLGPCMYA